MDTTTAETTRFAALVEARAIGSPIEGWMVAAWLACDRTYDGRFLVGVRTTGIYCLPSCRTPRRPKPENVVFLATPEEARAAGLRPCKLCRPDDFYRGHRPEEELVEGLLAAVGREPAAYRGVDALAAAAGVSATKLHALCRTYLHATPSDVLRRARVGAARSALLRGRRPVAEIAYAVGFESLSAFNETFRTRNAMSPVDYRRLAGSAEFVLALPADYPIDAMLRQPARDRWRVAERVDGRTYAAAFSVVDDDGSARRVVARVELRPGAARCRVEAAGAAPCPAIMGRVHGRVLASLGLASDPTRFEARAGASPDVARLIGGQRGLRLALVPDPFDGLVGAILGRRRSPAVAATLRRRLAARMGIGAGGGLVAPPVPRAVAALEPSDLTALGFPRATADSLIDAARAVVEGRLDLAALAGGTATRAERTLLVVGGVGPSSAHAVMMRSLGFLDCAPPGDDGLAEGLARCFALERRPGCDEAAALMKRFRPFRSLATVHLWQRAAASVGTDLDRAVPRDGENVGAAAD